MKNTQHLQKYIMTSLVSLVPLYTPTTITLKHIPDTISSVFQYAFLTLVVIFLNITKEPLS